LNERSGGATIRDMSTSTTHKGGCHCGKVRYEVTTPLQAVMECNCSHCARKGFLLTFVPPEQFKLLDGEDALTEYLFNKKAIHHLFCSTCGVQSFGRGNGPDGKPMIAVNVRCLDDVDLGALQVTYFDGKSR
jgi:hypothetical protein